MLKKSQLRKEKKLPSRRERGHSRGGRTGRSQETRTSRRKREEHTGEELGTDNAGQLAKDSKSWYKMLSQGMSVLQRWTIVGSSFMGGYHIVNSGMAAHVAQNTETSPTTFYWANKGWKKINMV